MATEKNSPLSSISSGTGSHGSPSVSTPGPRPLGGNEISLSVRKQPPTHVFTEEPFTVEFGIEMEKSSIQRTGDTDAEFVVTLHYSKNDHAVKEDVGFTYEPKSIWLSLKGSPPRRKKKITCKIRRGSVKKDKAEGYYIRLSPKIQDCPLSKDLAPVCSSTISIVNYKIKVVPDEEWESVFYKDEGGRDKCMTVVASLYDKEDQIFKGEQIPLQVTLFYANDVKPIKVTKQDTMRTIGAAKQFIDNSSGKATVRFRIEDVSKNHQGQDFRLEVAPDPEAKGFKDVAPGFSPAVSVRSKRNKRQRQPNSGARDQRLGSPPAPSGRSFYDEGRGDPQLSGQELPRLREALKGVIHWAEEVVNGLCTIQWQVIGYHQNPDGTTDYNRPYHNIPNPEPVLSRVMGMYSDTTREQLMTMLRSIDRGGTLPQDPYTMGNIAPPPQIPRGEGAEEGFHHNMPRAIAQQGLARSPYTPGMPASVTQEAFRDKTTADAMPSPQLMNFPPQQQAHSMRPLMQSQSFHRSSARQLMPPPIAGHQQAHNPLHNVLSPLRTQNREDEVAYVFAKQYKLPRTGEQCGFPVYNLDKELLGFYNDPTAGSGVAQFVPLSRYRDDFGPLETMQATENLHDALDTKSELVYALKDWGSISNLLDNALVHDWSKEMGRFRAQEPLAGD
mmetsp:Transcript_30265/g.46191  ORF Transcript_30265/g.46191 Transcript_30265/m.46191 type:complete len:669 (+) Transcript_30265:281-2287(+)|eukprot:CAMPEP_0194232968 /NCGR_PEP_ID=MMETSP0158-20130606/1120_1 /TAXON_ID=33649 /ORGANISM="Thalassionema nitzschioides, Strain L26-B" /LENGTH=668 /DNA_ID=CAMNT_0038965797 /DNA_START=198 /DNA_END=2204 /DNA_ORIENTATION=-